MPEHTAGPWTRGYGNYVYQGETVYTKGKLLAVCEPTTKTAADWNEVFANAKLIAAAPDLLAALQACHDVLLMDPRYESGRARFLADKAITKAKGELT